MAEDTTGTGGASVFKAQLEPEGRIYYGVNPCGWTLAFRVKEGYSPEEAVADLKDAVRSIIKDIQKGGDDG